MRGWLVIIMTVASINMRGQTLKLSQPELFTAYSFSIIGGVPEEFGHTDGEGTNALFGGTTGLAIDQDGNLYIADALLGGQTIRKMSPDGMVTTLAGESGIAGEVDQMGWAARFHSPHSVTVDQSGNLFVADSFGQTIRKVTAEGEVTTFAGLAFTEDSVDGLGEEARFRGPRGITIDKAGNLYVADHSGHTIRKVTPYSDAVGLVTTLAGRPLARGTNDGAGSAARFSYPSALTMGKDGNIYVADLGSGAIRRVTPEGVVSTLATGFGLLTGIASDSAGNLYVVDSYRHVINKVTPEGAVSTLDDVTGLPIRFKFGADHSSIAIDKDDNIYVADAGDNTILKAAAPPKVVTLFLSLTAQDPFQSAMVVTEATLDLRVWLPIQTNFVVGSTATRIVDTNAPNFPHHFYRARRLQGF